VKTPDELESDYRVLVTKIEDFIEATKDYRLALCKKLDIMNDKIDRMSDRISSMPCKVHVQRMEDMDKRLNSHSSHISKLWAACGTIVMIIVAAYFEMMIKR